MAEETKALHVRELRELIEGLDENTAVRVFNKVSKRAKKIEIIGAHFTFDTEDSHAELVFEVGEEAVDDEDD